ncbi:MAG TPA: PocR ligand-binding domain-containing protein, partial [Pyrinomonadaceae bacterium]
MKRSNSKARGTRTNTVVPQQSPEGSPAGWAEIQREIAEASGISFLLVNGHQPPALAVANNNSICEALQSSPEHMKLCDPYCGEAHARAIAANTITHYRCHAGLHCFAMPLEIETDRKLAVIGGRAFVRGVDYRETAERFRSGDLQDLFSDELFRNVIFADEADLDHAALRVSVAASKFKPVALQRGMETASVITTTESLVEHPAANIEPPQAEAGDKVESIDFAA